jgi:hypothetical protein
MECKMILIIKKEFPKTVHRIQREKIEEKVPEEMVNSNEETIIEIATVALEVQEVVHEKMEKVVSKPTENQQNKLQPITLNQQKRHTWSLRNLNNKHLSNNHNK